MNIIFDSPLVESLKQRHIVLELDTIEFDGLAQPIKTFCVIEQVPLTEIDTVEHWVKLHYSLITHYQKQDWKVCADAIRLLRGRWGGVVDSFYDEIDKRIQNFSSQSLPTEWTGRIKKTFSVVSNASAV
jgi:hypothetical protein